MQCLTRWAEAHPQTLELMNQLFWASKRCAFISGLVAVEHEVRPYTDDTDVFTHPDDFEHVARMVPDPTITRDKRVEMADQYGEVIWFDADELTATLDNTTLQIIRPLTHVNIGGRSYDVSHTDLVARNLRRRTLLGKQALFTHVFDSAAIKAVFQRSRRKHDLSDMRGLAAHCSPNDPYIARRAVEIGMGLREYRALGSAGFMMRQQPAWAA